MKILFVHLSDLHITPDFEVNTTKTDKLIAAIKSKMSDVDECILICSGDVANTANKNEYKVARKFFGKIINSLGAEIDKFIRLMIVPGNHDLLLPKGSRSSEEILSYYKDGSLMEKYNEELTRNEGFFEYATSKNCFKDSKVIGVKSIIFNDFRIQFNLINTSPFSTLEPVDKQVHYLSSTELRKLERRSDASLVITIMHHSPEWFYYESKIEFENLLFNNSDIIFIGHEHTPKLEGISCRNQRIKISRGGEYSGLYTKESAFIISILDTEDKSYLETIYEWDQTCSSFVNLDEKESIIEPNNIPFKNNEKFIKEFFCDNQGLKASCLDYFVFPELLNKTNDYEEKISNIKITEGEFFESLKKNKIINIIAPEEHGKTTFLKYLYSYYLKAGCIPLYFGKDNYDSKIERIERYLFENQYSDIQSDFSVYKQIDISKKVLLIDDYDKLANHHQRQNLIRYFENKVSTIILTSKTVNSADILTNINFAIESTYKIKTYEINRFYKKKRSELIRNICKTNPSLDGSTIDTIIHIMDKLVQSRTDMVILSPSTLIQFVKYFMSTNVEENKDDSVFLEILRNNIVNLLRENIKDSDIQEYINQLEELAYYMHFNNKPIISHEEIHMQIEKYNNEMLIQTNTNDFITKLVKATILTPVEKANHYRFKNKNYFAFFVARKIERNINLQDEAQQLRNKQDIIFLAKNICFTINDRILMFVSYLKNNTNFVVNLCNELPLLLNEFDEIDLDNYNIRMFYRAFVEKISIPSKKEKQQIEEAQEEIEIMKETSEDEISYINEYEYDEKAINKFPNNINRAIKYLEIISKSLVSQFSILNREKKEIISKAIFEFPNRIIYAILKPLDDNFDDYVKYAYQMINEIKKHEAKAKGEEYKEVTVSEIEDFLIDTSRAIALSIYDLIAFNSSTSKTINVLAMFAEPKGSNQIQKLMMFSNSKSPDEFIDQAIDLLNQFKNNLLVMTFIKLIVRVYVIRRPELSFRYIDRICSSILGPENKKELLLLKNKK